MYTAGDGLTEPAFDFVSFTPQSELIAARRNALVASWLDGYSISNFPILSE